MFGMVLQENTSVDEAGNEVKKAEKIKTREGKSTKLAELLDEAKERALKTYGSTSYNLRCRIERLIKESENL